jgi:hypothetical protein
VTSERRILAGHRFANEADYEAALRDYNKIEEIKKKIDFHNAEAIESLYNELQTGGITFESILGQEFDDEVYEAYMNYCKKGAGSLGEKKANKTSVGKNVNTGNKKGISLEDFDEDMQAQILKELKKKDRIRRGILIACALVAAGCLTYFGIYEYIQVNLTYSSNRMASNRLTREQVMELFRTNKISPAFEPMKVDDLIETIKQYNQNKLVIWDMEDLSLSSRYANRMHRYRYSVAI